MNEIINHDFLGLKISIFDKQQLINYINQVIIANDKKVCFGYSIGYITLLKKIPGLYEKCNNYDLMVTDGRIFYWVAKFFGAPLKFDISIPFLSELILDIANENNYSIMLIGSTEETNEKATEFIRKKYPNAIVYGGDTCSLFSASDQLTTVKKINAHKPNILFIGASTPKKEDFATLWKDQLEVNLIVPFGGMIDALAGKVKRTPLILKKLGLSAFVRTAQEPKRLFVKNVWMFYEVFFKIFPLIFYYKFLLREKHFNIVELYKRI